MNAHKTLQIIITDFTTTYFDFELGLKFTYKDANSNNLNRIEIDHVRTDIYCLKNDIAFLLSKEINTITIMKQSMKTNNVMRK